ncbi:serine hydrolase domain-containing protein [Paraburkholderia sp. GAS82]|uniref:serine hydrolase domain-containing protein n=1 Tax=Paraburkholderia sp. GAS82 TaxID=3035137 RepID=UPI003D1ED614
MCATPRAENYAVAAQEIVSAFLHDDLFTGVVLVAKAGEIIFRQGFGFANRQWAIPNTPETRFRIGSITKQFTAAAILRLTERGKLGVHDRLGQHLPDAPESWHNVTIHQLLTHTSGVPSYTDLPDFLTRISLEERTPKAIMELTSGQALEFPPGDRFRYSNTGYILLGSVVEAISGQRYSDFLESEFFQPLGMADSGYDHTWKIVERRADGYTCIGGKWRHARFIAMSLPHAAGGLYSTADDLYRWSQALMRGDVIGPAALQHMLRDHGQGYGYGWFVGSADGRRFVRHGGAINGFLSALDLHPDDDLTVIALANLQASGVLKITERLAHASLGLYQTPHEITLDASKLDEYLGVFRLGQRCFMEISLDKSGMLCAHLTGLQRLTLACSESDAFFSRTRDIEIAFSREAEGKASVVTLREHGVSFAGRRIDDAVYRKIRERQPENGKDISADSTELSQYVGRYRHPLMHFEVTLCGEQLSVQATGQQKSNAVFESGRCFVLDDTQARITFEYTDRDGVWGLTLRHAGTQLRAFRLFDVIPMTA